MQSIIFQVQKWGKCTFTYSYHGPIPIFGIAVGAMIPFTSCWIILCAEKEYNQNVTYERALFQKTATK